MRVKNESEKIERKMKRVEKEYMFGGWWERKMKRRCVSLFRIDTIDSSVKLCRPVKST